MSPVLPSPETWAQAAVLRLKVSDVFPSGDEDAVARARTALNALLDAVAGRRGHPGAKTVEVEVSGDDSVAVLVDGEQKAVLSARSVLNSTLVEALGYVFRIGFSDEFAA